jgi:plasmid stabilization system protein ParE
VDKQSCEIRWTENAISDYNRIILYLLANWSEKVALNFAEIIQNKLKILANNSLMGISSEKLIA